MFKCESKPGNLWENVSYTILLGILYIRTHSLETGATEERQV